MRKKLVFEDDDDEEEEGNEFVPPSPGSVRDNDYDDDEMRSGRSSSSSTWTASSPSPAWLSDDEVEITINSVATGAAGESADAMTGNATGGIATGGRATGGSATRGSATGGSAMEAGRTVVVEPVVTGDFQEAVTRISMSREIDMSGAYRVKQFKHYHLQDHGYFPTHGVSRKRPLSDS